MSLPKVEIVDINTNRKKLKIVEYKRYNNLNLAKAIVNMLEYIVDDKIIDTLCEQLEKEKLSMVDCLNQNLEVFDFLPTQLNEYGILKFLNIPSFNIKIVDHNHNLYIKPLNNL